MTSRLANSTQSFFEINIICTPGYLASSFRITGIINMAISDSLYRFLLSSGIMVGGTGLAWMLMKVIVPTKEDMLKVVL